MLPFLVLVGWGIGQPLSLDFDGFETSVILMCYSNGEEREEGGREGERESEREIGRERERERTHFAELHSYIHIYIHTS